MKTLRRPILLFICAICCLHGVSFAAIESAMSGAWQTPSTWVGGLIPGAGDDVVVKANHSVHIADARACGALTVEASGTLHVTGASASLTQSGSALINGIVNVNTGTLSQSGSFVVNGTLTFQNSAIFNQSETAVLNGLCSLHGSYSFGANAGFSGPGSLSLSSGSFTFHPGSSIPSILSLSGGTLIDQVGFTYTNLTLTSGTISGNLNSTVSGTFLWTGGILSGNGVLTVNGSLAISGTLAKQTQDAKILRVASMGSITDANLTLSGTSKLQVATGGSFTATGNVPNVIFQIGGSTGTIELQSGSTFTKAGVGIIAFACNVSMNGAMVNVETGKLLSASHTGHVYGNSDVTIGGNWTIQNGTHTFQSMNVHGPGVLEITGGPTINYETGSSLTTQLHLITGTLTSSVFLNPSEAAISGTISGPCDVDVSGNMVFNNGGFISNVGDLNVSGALTWNGGSFGDGTSTGIVTIEGLTTITTNFAKAIRKKTVTLNGGAMYQSGNFSVQNAGTLHIPTGTTFTLASSANGFFLSGSGEGGTVLNEGHFIKEGSLTYTIGGTAAFNNEGTLRGTGLMSFTSFTNSGIVSPGNSPGIFSLNRFLNGNSVLRIEIAGSGGAGLVNGHDQLTVTGTPAGLGGTLEIHLLDGFVPATGESFIIANLPTGYSSTSFSGVDMIGLPPGFGWTISYNATNVTVTFCPVWYQDADGDSAGDPNTSQISCTPPPGYVAVAGDACPIDPDKIAPGTCGCGMPETDTDGDGTPDCTDACPGDPNKILPGICGCAHSEPGSGCDDGNPFTINDLVNTGCVCEGEFFVEPTCDDGVSNGMEVGIDCGGPDCDPCLEPEAICGVITVYVNQSYPDYNGPSNKDVWLIPANALDAGSISYSDEGTLTTVKRYASNITFDWTNTGGCVVQGPNGGSLSLADKGLVYTGCYPAIPGNFNVYKFYSLKIADEFGSDECVGTVKLLAGVESLQAPTIHFVIPNTEEFLTMNHKDVEEDNDEFQNVPVDVIVSPNPGDDILTVEFESHLAESVLLSIHDVTGREVFVNQYHVLHGTNRMMIEMSGYPAGIYVVMINSHTITASEKWIKTAARQ